MTYEYDYEYDPFGDNAGDEDETMTTQLDICSDNFRIKCPHCDTTQERIYIGGRVFDPEILCDGCNRIFVLEINVLEG